MRADWHCGGLPPTARHLQVEGPLPLLERVIRLAGLGDDRHDVADLAQDGQDERAGHQDNEREEKCVVISAGTRDSDTNFPP